MLIDGLIITGRFERPDHMPVTGAAVHAIFLGDPPGNCGTALDLERSPAHTDDRGQFRISFPDPDGMLRECGPPGIWRRGCFLVVAVKDGRTIGYIVASGDELLRESVCLTALATVTVRGRVVDDASRGIEGAAVESDHYFLPVGRGPHPHAPVNFWISRGRGVRITELTARTGEDGSFCLSEVPVMPGGLWLRVTNPGRADLKIRYDPLKPLPPVVIKAAAEVRVRVLLSDGSPAPGLCLRLSGRAVDAPDTCGITGIPVGVVGHQDRDADTDGEGRCLFGGLAAGNYSIHYVGLVERLEAWQRQGLQRRDYSIPQIDGPRDRLALPVIEVGPLAGGERREIEAGAVEGSVLCGTICQAKTRAPIEHAWVRYEGAAYPRNGSALQSAYTDAEGRFATWTALVPGPLTVWVSAVLGGKRLRFQHEVVVRREPRTELDLETPFDE
jgi:hypothetical protein